MLSLKKTPNFVMNYGQLLFIQFVLNWLTREHVYKPATLVVEYAFFSISLS